MVTTSGRKPPAITFRLNSSRNMAQRAPKVWLSMKTPLLLAALVGFAGLGLLDIAAQDRVLNSAGNVVAGAAALPESPGKDQVVRVCSQCHNLERIANPGRTS